MVFFLFIKKEMEMVTQLLVKVAECWEIHSVHHIYSSSFSAHLEMIIWSVEFHKSSKSLTFKVWNLVSISEANCCSSQFVNIIQTQQVIAKCYWLVGAPTISANGQLHKRKTTLTPSIMSCHMVLMQCQDEFRNLSGCVLKIPTDSRTLQISIPRCQIEPEIHSFPTMYGKGGYMWQKLVK